MFNCAVAGGGGRGGTLQTYHWRVWGALPVSGPHWVCPRSHVCAFLVYTALAPGRSAGDLSKVGPGLRALSWSKLLRFRFLRAPQRHRLGWVCVLCPSQVLAAQVTGCLVSSLSPGGGCVSSPAQSQLLSPGGGVSHHLPSPSCCSPGGGCISSPAQSQLLSPGAPREHHLRYAVSPLGSLSLAATLLADVNHPGS